MPTSIKIENLSKQYRLGTIGTGTLSHDLKRWWTTSIRGKEDPYLKIGETNILASNQQINKSTNQHINKSTNQQINKSTNQQSNYIWALRDINLEIEQGDVVGIIGKNGAGKSTLLKILSRVTKPTTGSIKYNGRIASLLEVGTGFHPEMTGRENIYMNGAIMGMTRYEITSKLDEIIAFAGVERYIDTPVKRYSSGMTVRLGFSIAAYLEPDILVVDEVLAVGDAEFQKKAIGKMQDVSKGGGRTVLFVSHNMAAVKNLCNKSILMDYGQILKEGNTYDVIDDYYKITNIAFNPTFVNSITNNKSVYIESFKVNDDIKTGGKFEFEAVIYSDSEIDVNFAIGIRANDSSPIYQIFSAHNGQSFSLKKQKSLILGHVDCLPLSPGTYQLQIWLGKGITQIDNHFNAMNIMVKEGSLKPNYPISLKTDFPVIADVVFEQK